MLSAEVQVTKSQLRELLARRGWLETDCGRILLELRGSLQKGGLYAIEVHTIAPSAKDADRESFSLTEFLKGS
jgi:hypothetical protein